jgi:hypothetical protein
MTNETWGQVREELIKRVGKHNYATWIEPLKLSQLKNGVARFEVPTIFFGDWVQRNYADHIRSQLTSAGASVDRVEFTVGTAPVVTRAAATGAAKPAPKATRARAAEEELPGAPLDARFTFDSFVVGKPNELAHAAARRVAEGGPVTFNPLFLYGGVGLGKARFGDDLRGHGRIEADERVDLHPGELVGVLDGEGLDVHAPLDAAHREVGAVGPVEQEAEVILLRDLGTLGDHHPLDGVALDVHAEDLRGQGLRLLGGSGHLDAPGLAASAGLHLRLDDDDAPALGSDPLGGGAGLFGRLGHLPGQHGHTVRLEHVTCLVLVQIHGRPSSSSK